MSREERQPLEAKKATEIEVEAEIVEEKRQARGAASHIALVLSLVTLLALAVGLFLGYRYWQGMQQSLELLNTSLAQAGREQVAMREHLSQTQQAFQQQQQKMTVLGQELSGQQQRTEQERESLQQQGVQLNRALAEMQQRLGGKTSQWRVAEAEYLLRLANHRLALMQDPATAIEALKSADERLRDTGDPGWNEVRQILAQEMSALTAVSTLDRAGLNASINALLEQVDQLPPKREGVPLAARQEARPNGSPDPIADGSGLQRILQDLWAGFKSMMVIRKHDQPIGAMLPPAQSYFLKQNLLLKLEGAKIALMGRDNAFYQDNLRSSGAWVERYFATGSPRVQGFIEQLTVLAQAQIDPQLPDISASLRALQKRREELTQGANE